MGRWPGIPRPGGDSGGLAEHIVAAIRDFAKLGNRLSQITFLHGVSDGGSVEGAVEQLILGAHNAAYRMQIRFR